jgi:hypothetical protein
MFSPLIHFKAFCFLLDHGLALLPFSVLLSQELAFPVPYLALFHSPFATGDAFLWSG